MPGSGLCRRSGLHRGKGATESGREAVRWRRLWFVLNPPFEFVPLFGNPLRLTSLNVSLLTDVTAKGLRGVCVRSGSTVASTFLHACRYARRIPRLAHGSVDLLGLRGHMGSSGESFDSYSLPGFFAHPPSLSTQRDEVQGCGSVDLRLFPFLSARRGQSVDGSRPGSSA